MSALPSIGNPSPSVKATIGKSVVVKGEIQSREDLVIEGTVEGTIDIPEHRLTVDPNGSVNAGIKARVVEVQGSIEGEVDAIDKVYIRKGAKFIGDLHSTGIVIDDGAFIKGNVDLSQPPSGSGASNPAS